MKIRNKLLEKETISYAMDYIDLPEGGIDCSEGCNPYGFPPACGEALRNFDPLRMAEYPHSHALHEAITEYWKDQIDIEYDNILVTDGSISGLYIINNIFDTHNAVVVGMSPQFTDYYMHADMIGIEYAPYQLRREYNYKFDSYEFLSMHFIAKKFAEVSMPAKAYNFIYIDNPNNPTGQCMDIEEVEYIVKKALKQDVTVIIDEAYGDFMPKENSAVQLFDRYPNLVVVRSLSKAYGLAGLRIGYIIAHKDLIGYMKKMVNPYMGSEIAREVGAVALKHEEFLDSCKADFAEMKQEIMDVLSEASAKKRHTVELSREELEAELRGENRGDDDSSYDGDSAEEEREPVVSNMSTAGRTPTGRLHMAETLADNSLLLLYHDNSSINLKDEFYKRGVLVIDGYDFKGLDSSAARVRLPKKEEFPKLLEAIREINLL